MSTLLFSLRGVPEDEAEDIRQLLDEHHIDYYETDAGNWGISMPALWLQQSDDLPRARQLLDDYQLKRQTEQRRLYEDLKKAGKAPTTLDLICQHPVEFFFSIGFIGVILYISYRLVKDFGLQ